MDDNQNLTPDQDPRLIEALAQLSEHDIRDIDELTRRRHLAQMRASKSTTRRLRFVGVAAAFMLIIGGFVVTRSTSTINRQPSIASEPQELAPLKKVAELTTVPFERAEDYVILEVSSSRAKEVGSDIVSTLGGLPTIIGKNDSATTYVVPASFAKTLSNTTGITTTVDSPVKATAEQTPTPSWGLDRIDATDVPLNDSYRYVSTGASSYVYVIDTGVYSGHSDLAGRVTSGYSAVSDGNGSEDCNGHGTHVAGTIAGSTYGVAKSSRVVAVRVLDCAGSGFSSSVVAGINWVIQSHPGGAGIINMSLGGSANTAVDAAVANATAAGLTVVVAAGNDSANACSYSPARAPSALTIGAIDRTDARASYSNSGSCVDLWAPGTSIKSNWIGSPSATRTISGTSMATPHVAGLAARLAQAFPGITNSEIVSKLSVNKTTTLPVTTFVEEELPVDSTTTTVEAVTTTVEPTTTTSPPDVSVPVDTTVAPTTTVPRVTTTTVPRTPDTKKPKIVRPRVFVLRYQSRAGTTSLIASWFGNNTPESYRISCVNKRSSSNNDASESESELEAEAVKYPADTVILVGRDGVTVGRYGYTETVLTTTPERSSRCSVVALIGTAASERSNVWVMPRAPRVPTTTTTTSTTSTTTSTTTTISPSTTVATSKTRQTPTTIKQSKTKKR